MGGRRWTEEETAYLRENYGIATPMELEFHLHRTFAAIKIYARKNGIKSVSNGVRWSEDEIEYLEKWHGRASYKYIAQRLNRSEGAVRHMAQVQKLGDFKLQTDCMCIAEVARLLGKTDGNMRYYYQQGVIKTKKIGAYRMIHPNELIRFMKKYPQYWSAMQCEQWYFENYPWFHERLLQERHEAFDKVG